MGNDPTYEYDIPKGKEAVLRLTGPLAYSCVIMEEEDKKTIPLSIFPDPNFLGRVYDKPFKNAKGGHQAYHEQRPDESGW